jgi:hypothetical protein
MIFSAMLDHPAQWNSARPAVAVRVVDRVGAADPQ